MIQTPQISFSQVANYFQGEFAKSFLFQYWKGHFFEMQIDINFSDLVACILGDELDCAGGVMLRGAHTAN